MDKIQFSFILDRQKKLVTRINKTVPEEKEDFFSFFHEYLSSDIFQITDAKFNATYFLDFLSQAKKGDFLRFFNIDKISFDFCIREKDDRYVKVGVSRGKEFREERDYLTGVKSRSYLFSAIQEERSKDDNQDAYLLRIDLDEFKDVNDTRGHIAGDRCLKSIAEQLHVIFQKEIFGRYGGDEFLCYVKHCSKEKLIDYIKKVLAVSFQYARNGLTKKTVTCSVGCSLPINERKNIFLAIQEADSALYKAKNSGKNCGYLYLNGKIENNQPKKKQKAPKPEKEKTSSIFKHERKQKRKRCYIILGVVATIFVAVIATVDFSFREKTNAQAEKIAVTFSKDQGTRVRKETKSHIELSYSQLENGVNGIKAISYNGDKNTYITDCLYYLNNTDSIVNPGIVFSNGDIYYSSGKASSISGTEVFENLTKKKSSFINLVTLEDGEEKVLLGYPCSIDLGNENNVCAVTTILDKTQFSSFIFGDTRNGKSYLALAKDDGSVLCHTRAQDFDYFKGYHNLNERFDEDNNPAYSELFASSLESGDGQVNTLLLKRNGADSFSDFYFYCTKRTEDENDPFFSWRILVVVPDKLPMNYRSPIQRYSRLSITLISAVFFCFIFISFFVAIHLSRQNFKKKYTDSLTGTINESRFSRDSVTLLKEHPNQYYLVYFNVRGFKNLNNSLGRSQSEKVLEEIARLIELHLSEDELLCHQISDRFRARRKADDDEDCRKRVLFLLNYLSDSCQSSEGIPPHFSAGIYQRVKPNEPIYLSIERAKKICISFQGDTQTNSVERFDRASLENEERETYIEESQESALALGKFNVYYQGKFDTKKKVFAGCEALVRWNDARFGNINTQTFINVFENNGFILKLDLYVFEAVLRDIQEARKEGKEIIPVSVNVSRRHFEKDNFFDEYEKLRHKYEVPGEYLEFEITESIVLNNQRNLSQRIDQIHALGSKISIDDFGSGFSNLSRLNRTDYDILKIDKNLLYGKDDFDFYSKNILKMVVNLNKSLGKQVVCEGVDKKEEADYLTGIGCDLIQGYYYAVPRPKAAFVDLRKSYQDKKEKSE